jgi:glycosyltransferase involved in cell wall biosynthesis
MLSLCFITTCMGRLDQLRQTLGASVAQPGCSCIVVDYSCPERAGDWVEANYPGVCVVRREGMSEFNASAARNAGAAVAEAEWLCFVDADVRLEPGFAEEMRARIRPGTYYRAASDDGGLGGTFVCARDDFERVGGYDEVYQGWGEEDNDLFDALRFHGLHREWYPGSLARHLPHGDDRRTRFYTIKDRRVSHEVNRVYRIIKWDVAGMWRRALPPDDRARLYEEISRHLAAGSAENLEIELRPIPVPGGSALARRLIYRIDKETAEGAQTG